MNKQNNNEERAMNELTNDSEMYFINLVIHPPIQ